MSIGQQMDIHMQSVSSIYKEQNRQNNLTDTKLQNPKYQIFIGSESSQFRAIPQSIPSFYKYLILCLFNILKQWHVIYFITLVVAKSFYTCDFQIQQMIPQTILILIYLVLEIILRYKTYKCYIVADEKLKNNKFQVWSTIQNNWKQLSYEDLKPGQIIKIPSTIDNNNILNPVNVLPIHLSSKRSHFQLKTTRINKFQEIKEIPIFSFFKKIFAQENSMVDIVSRLTKIRIYYEYVIENSDIFEGKIKSNEFQNDHYYISNKLILPNGVPIVGQQYLIGVILPKSSNINQKSLKRALNASNQTISKIGKAFIPLFYCFISITIGSFAAQLLIIGLSPRKRANLSSQVETYLCLALNNIALASHFIYIGMFIFLLIHRLRDSKILKKKNGMLIKNYIKSIDQFGQTNTIIMDDYFFIDKNLFKVDQMVYNYQSQIQINQQLIFYIIQKSQRLKEQMYDVWISVVRYLRQQPRRYTKVQNQYKIQIMKQKIFKQSFKYSIITLIIQISEHSGMQKSQSLEKSSSNSKRYFFRFSQKPRLNTIERIKNQKLKLSVKQLVKKKDLIHLMIEALQTNITSTQFDNQSLQYLSRNYEASRFQFLGLISSKLNVQSHIYPLSLIKNQQIIKKQNLIILSNKKWKYIELALQKNNISTSHLISLEQKQFVNIKYDIQHHLRQLRDMNDSSQKNLILAIHCNLVSYLTRPQIIRGLIRLAQYSKYIIFYDCSQYEKQVCCMNLFQIFPLHIYLTNYLCDLQIIQKSNLSVCQQGESTQAYVTLVVKTYKDLRFLILNQAVQSINITVYIIKSFLFKNQILVLTFIITQFIVYQGKYFVLGIQYTGLIYLTYNVITSLPILYYIVFRPQVWQQPLYKNKDSSKVYEFQYITARKLLKQFLRALIISTIIVIINYSFLLTTLIQNIFFSVIISCVIASGLYNLFIDDARQKKVQVILVIALYIIFYLYIYLLQLFNSGGYQLVIIQTNITSNGKDSLYFFLSNFIVCPFLLGFIFFGMSAFDAKIQPQESRKGYQISQISSLDQIPAKSNQDYGKQLRFRQQ